MRTWLGAVLLLIAAIVGTPRSAHPAAQPALVVRPPSTVVGVGGVMQYFAVHYPNGIGNSLPDYVDPTAVSWSSSDTGVLEISAGVALGRSRGRVIVTARYQGMVAQTPAAVVGTVTSSSLVTADGRLRTYSLYVPESYTPAPPTPLVLVFHGKGSNGRLMMSETLMNAVAHQYRFLVAYPDGLGGGGAPTGWNGGGNGGYAAQNHIDDVGFTRQLIDDIAARVNVDLRRVYATGFSNGAVFTHRLGFELADRIAAIAPVAGPLVPGGDFVPGPPTRPVPVLEFHGTTDETASYYPAVPMTTSVWLGRNGISPSSSASSYQRGIEGCQTYARPEASVSLCTASPPAPIDVNGVLYDGGGHAWPGGERGVDPASDIPTYDIDASHTMWRFFAAGGAFPLPASSLVAAVLPGSRSVTVGAAATAFVSVTNAGPSTAFGVGISAATPIPATLTFQSTDPATNALTGAPNTAVDIAPGQNQTFVVSITPSAPFEPVDVALDYGGANTAPVSPLPGINTLLVSGSPTPVPDIVAIAATTDDNGIVGITGTSGTGAFAVASVNLGSSGAITVSADTGSADLPLALSLCQTDSQTGRCLTPVAAAVATVIGTGTTPSFGIFVVGHASVPFDPAVNRIFVRFRDSGGVTRGSTSVAVRTQ